MKDKTERAAGQFILFTLIRKCLWVFLTYEN